VAEAAMEEIERSAASVEEAIEAALSELGISEQEAQVEIVQEPRSGFLGIASQPAVVRVRYSGAPPAPSPSDEADEADGAEGAEGSDVEGSDAEDQADLAAGFLDGLLDAMGLDAQVDIEVQNGVTYVEVWTDAPGEDMGLLIGKKGHTLDALQELVRGYIARQGVGRCEVLVDVEDYRKRRRAQVMSRVRDAGRRVKRSGRPEALEPMNSYERKLVHDAVGTMEGLESASEGEEPNRRVVIRPARP
jgi:spoIIIJ-associated protein